jgi:Mn2+/Fe2+ NRAMP family transporter
VAGAHYGYSLLWMMPLVALALIVVQEMSARLGVVTGKGLADLIRERLGVRWTAVIIGILVFANLTNTVSEFAGVAASMEIFGVSKYVAVPIAAAIVWLLIVKADYKFVEQVFLIASAIYLAYVASGILAQPSWGEVARFAVTPSFHLDVGYVTLFALGLLNASIFSAAILPLSTAYVVCEAFGWEAAVSRSFS